MEQLDKFKRIIHMLIKIINISLALFLVSISIPGYLHLIDIYNKHIKDTINRTNISTFLICFVVTILAVYIFLVVFLSIGNHRMFNIKSLIVMFFITIIGVVLAIGYIGFSDVHDIGPVAVMFITIYAFIAGIKFTCSFEKNIKPN